MITRPRRSVYRGAAVLAALCLAVVCQLPAGCGRQPDPRGRFCDLEGVPLSAELAGPVREGLAALRGPQPDNRTTRTLRLCDELVASVDRPAERDAAGERLFAAWRAEPTRLLWIDAIHDNMYVLDREDAFLARAAEPPLDDVTGVPGAYLWGLHRRRQTGGEELRRLRLPAAGLDTLDQVWLQRMLARLEAGDGDPLAAARRLLAWLPAARAAGGSRLESFLWLDLGSHLADDRRLDDALHALTLAAAMAARVGDDYQETRCRLRLGMALAERGEGRRAVASLEATVAEALRRDQPYLATWGLNRGASVCAGMGDEVGALRLDHRSLALARAAADSFNVPRTLSNVAYDLLQLGRLDSAGCCLREARRWVDAVGHPRLLVRMPLQEAWYWTRRGEFARADSLLREVRRLSDGATLASEEAHFLVEQLELARDMGRPDLAYLALDRLGGLGDVLRDRLADQNLRADLEIATADLLGRQGEFLAAAEALARADRAVAESGGEGKAAECRRCAGDLALLRGDAEAAGREFAACRRLAHAAGDSAGAAEARLRQGKALLEAGRDEEARSLLAAAADDRDFGGRYRTVLESRIMLAVCEARRGRPERALEMLAACRAAAGERVPPDLLVLWHLERGRSLAALGRAEGAEADLLEAGRLLEAGAGPDPLSELAAYHRRPRRRQAEALLGLYRDHPELLGGGEPAARTLLLAERLRAADSAVLMPVSAAAAVAGSVPASRPAEVAVGSPPGAAEVPLADLARGGRLPLLAFFVGEDRSFWWSVTEGGVAWGTLPGRRELREALAPVLADLRSPARTVDGEALARLGSLLLGPVAGAWPPGATLTIVADDLLAAVPWAALPLPAAPTGCALERGPICQAPSLQAAAAPARPARPAELPLLAIASDADLGSPDEPADRERAPRLRQATREARALAGTWPAEHVLVDAGPTAGGGGVWPPDPGRFGVIHVASHAEVHQGLPGSSTLRLASPGGSLPLTLGEIAGLGLRAELVFLSCCEADRRHSAAGDPIDSFARAFLAGGARAVIASGLRLDDEAAAALAASFYRHWLQGESRAAALRSAQLEVRGAPGSPRHHPHHWAGYRLIGDGS